ncbi:MAG TPA: hypothetical protein VFA47_14065 [Candidatus Manganitrophaceae bacterium]|nr:hypothetical protein [Candidatus Manganitrophaceae bacterium]
MKQVKAINKKATKYTKGLLQKGARALEQGVGKIEEGAEKLGNVLLKPFRS